MNDRKKQVMSFVRKRLMYWQTEPNPHLVRADLANLRRGIGKKPGELPQLWEPLFRDFPEELMSQNGNPTWEEWAVCGALTLYAMHQQGNDQKMHMDGQRLGIAIALLGNPHALILDEPINGLDPLGVIQIRRLLTDLCHKKHITILISSHNMHELYQVATKYLFLDRGKVVKSVSSDELDQERSLENFFLSLIGGEHHA